MTMFEKFREYTARRALEYKIYSELSHISDAELRDLNLSRTKLVELSRQQAMVA